jgi:hypothetical protein
MLAELHAHTSYSLGKKIYHHGIDKPIEMLKQAKKLGLDVIAITDHDVIEGALIAKKISKRVGIEVIVGEEISTKHGHVIALGIKHHIKPKLDFESTIDEIHAQGGIAIAAHPFDIHKEGVRELAKKCDAVEVFNALNLDRISNHICEKFALKNSLPIVAGSDAHCKEMIGYGATKIECNSKNTDDVLRAIKKKKVKIIKRYPSVKTIREYAVKRLKMSYDYTVRYMDEHYSLPKRYIGKKLIKLIKMSPGRIDYIFQLLGYTSLLGASYYSALLYILNK